MGQRSQTWPLQWLWKASSHPARYPRRGILLNWLTISPRTVPIGAVLERARFQPPSAGFEEESDIRLASCVLNSISSGNLPERPGLTLRSLFHVFVIASENDHNFAKELGLSEAVNQFTNRAPLQNAPSPSL